MTRAKNLTEAPETFLDQVEWIIALDAFDYCDPEPLAELVLKQDIPLELRPALAAIVRGHRKQKKSAANKLKIPAAKRLRIATSLSWLLGLWNISKYDASNPARSEEKGARLHAELEGIEPIEAVKYYERMARKTIEEFAAEYGVSTETMENLLRDLRRKIESYPDV